MKNKKKAKKENSERWLLTYSDLITLLMILFILLYAMSNVNQEKYEQLSDSLKESMGGGAGHLEGSNGVFPENGSDTPVNLGGSDNQTAQTTPMPTPVPTTVPGITGAAGSGLNGSLKTEQDMVILEQYVKQILLDLNMGVSTETSMADRGLTITFKNDVFFDSGKAVLKEGMKEGLTKIAKLLIRVDNKIIIEGHTDNVPISSKNIYTSNWQLSAARAANVAQYLAETGQVDGNRISAVGFGEYHPIASNDTEEGRSKNRRVDIVILYDDAGE